MRFLFKKTATNRILFFLIADIFLIVFSVFLAFLLRFEGTIPSQYFESGTVQRMVILALVFCLPVFYFFRLYSFSWKYVSANELISLFKAVTLSFIFLIVSLFVLQGFEGFPRSIIFVSYLLIFILCGAIRFSKRVYLELFKKGKTIEEKERTLIVGAGDAGEQISRNILASTSSPYSLIGFVDDSSAKQGLTIHGLKVLGEINDIANIVNIHNIQEMIIALPSAGGRAIKKAVELGRKAGLQKIKIVPPISEIINGEISLRNIREIRVEDLLGRESVKLDTKAIESFVNGKEILITGAAGSIGSELARQIAKFNPSLLLLLDQDETGIFNISEELKIKFPYSKIKSLIADIRDKRKIKRVFENFKPRVVFHAAAYKHVPLMEKHPDEAVKNNIFGVRNVAEEALANGVEKLIFISTDKAVNPTSVMGATKRMGEMICQAKNQENRTKFISVRFGNVLNSRGNVIRVFEEQIKKGGPVKITHQEMKRYFMTTSEACLLVMQAGEIGQGGEVFVLDMGKPIRISDLAKEMIRLYGLEPDKDIPIVFTEPRPGEKFFEEILTAEEGTTTTQHQKIFRAKLSLIEKRKIDENLERLREAIKKPGSEEIINILRILMPSFRP